MSNFIKVTVMQILKLILFLVNAITYWYDHILTYGNMHFVSPEGLR